MAKIFFSYRRGDTAGYAGRLYDDLSSKFGEQVLFRDIDTIGAGADFVTAITDAVNGSDVVLAVIGPGWLGAASEGRRRLDDPEDFVRLELTTALTAGKRIVPVLVARAELPAPAQLPGPLRPLLRHNAIDVSDERWGYDVDRLVSALGPIMAPRAAGPPADQPESPLPRSARRFSFRGVQPVLGLLAVIAFFAGINRAIDTSTDEDTSARATGPGPSRAGAALKPAVRELDATVWFQGFEIRFQRAEATSEEGAGRLVELHAMLENESPAAVDFGQQTGIHGTFLSSKGNNYPLSRAAPALVPGAATANATLAFSVNDEFSFDDAVLTLGKTDNNQTVVALSGTGKSVPRAPRPLQIAGKVTAGQVTVEAAVAEVRWDAVFEERRNPVPVPRGQAAVAIVFTATTTARYGYNFNKDGLALRRPDGTTVFSDYCCAGIYPETPGKNLQANFLVPDPPAGNYELMVLALDDKGEKRSASLPFKLE